MYKSFLVAFETGGIDAAWQLARERGLLNVDGDLVVGLVVDSPANTSAVARDLEALNVVVDAQYEDRIQARIPRAEIERRAADPQGLAAFFEEMVRLDHVIRVELPVLNHQTSPLMMDGEGPRTIGADAWHAAGFTGAGVRVGILDLGFDGREALLGSDLPDQVEYASFGARDLNPFTREVHGTACAEIVHEVAPDAELLLARYDGQLASEAEAVDWLIDHGAQIISHSAGAYSAPMDGTGPLADIVERATARGALWVNSAGNEAQQHYRTEFQDVDGDGYHDFRDGGGVLPIHPMSRDLEIVVNWNDWNNVDQDYDFVVYDVSGSAVAQSTDAQSGDSTYQRPSERIVLMGVGAGPYYLTIQSAGAGGGATFDVYTHGAHVEWPVPGHSLVTPGDARGSLTVGATKHTDDSLAVYSSQGPTNDERLKPDLTAPSGIRSASYSPEVFNGTSASAPHVAGAAALVLSAFPDFLRNDVADYLTSNAQDLGPLGADPAFGFGRVQMPDPPGQGPPLQTPPVVASAIIPTTSPPALASVTTPPLILPSATLPLPITPGSSPPAGQAPTPSATPTEAGAVRGGDSDTITPTFLGFLGGILVLAGIALTFAAAGSRSAPAGVAFGVLMTPEGSLALRGTRILIGRRAGCDIIVDRPLVSREHAVIQNDVGGPILNDLGSTNGTFVNGHRVSRQRLRDGDVIGIGRTDLTYHDHQSIGSASRPMFGKLELSGRSQPISSVPYLIGRGGRSALVLDDVLASHEHARIQSEGDTLVLIDLDSTNGIYVNGVRAQKWYLVDGDVIRIGRTELRYYKS